MSPQEECLHPLPVPTALPLMCVSWAWPLAWGKVTENKPCPTSWVFPPAQVSPRIQKAGLQCILLMLIEFLPSGQLGALLAQREKE